MKRKIILSILILLFFITGCQKNDFNDKKEVIEYVIFKVDNKVYKANVELENGYILNLPEQPKKDGYIFSYWEQNGKRYDITDKLEANTILNAVFEKVDTKDIVRITLVKNNGEPNEIVEVKKNEKITILNTPKKENYEFLGW